MMLTDKYAYSSKLSQVSPKAKLFFSFVPLVLCIGFNSIAVSTVTILIMAYATVRFGRMTLRKYIKFLLIPFGFLTIGVITVLINSYPPGHALLVGIRVGESAYGIDKASVVKSIKLVFKALGAVSCMYFLSLNTPMSDLFQVLSRLRVPAVMVALMELIYRYIFVIMEEAQRMIIARDSRLGNINFRTALTSLGEMISMLFLRAYQRSDRIYAALEARGYNGSFVTLEEEYIYSRKMNTASVLLCLAIILIWLLERFLI